MAKRSTRRATRKRTTRKRALRGGGAGHSRPGKIELTRKSPSRSSSPSAKKMENAPAHKTYRLAFEAWRKNNDGSPLTAKEKTKTEKIIEGANWYDYVVSVMENAIEREVPVDDVDVTAKFHEDKVERGVGPISTFTGVVTWKSVACDLKAVKEQVEWFIGDRMSMYELDEEGEDGWHIFITPGVLTVV